MGLVGSPGLIRAPGLAPSTCTGLLFGLVFTVASAFLLSADLTQQRGSGAKVFVLAHVSPLLVHVVIANVLLVKVLMPTGIAMTNSIAGIAYFISSMASIATDYYKKRKHSGQTGYQLDSAIHML
jgi:hypothetical protein